LDWRIFSADDCRLSLGEASEKPLIGRCFANYRKAFFCNHDPNSVRMFANRAVSSWSKASGDNADEMEVLGE
jgi:hypothetical protein